jgi:hypothetical protein
MVHHTPPMWHASGVIKVVLLIYRVLQAFKKTTNTLPCPLHHYEEMKRKKRKVCDLLLRSIYLVIKISLSLIIISKHQPPWSSILIIATTFAKKHRQTDARLLDYYTCRSIIRLSHVLKITCSLHSDNLIQQNDKIILIILCRVCPKKRPPLT